MNDSKPVNRTLSVRETEIVAQVYKGLSNKETADALCVSEKTVKFHLTNIFRKLGLKSRSQLIVWEIQRRNPAPPTPALMEETSLPVGESLVETEAGVRTRGA